MLRSGTWTRSVALQRGWWAALLATCTVCWTRGEGLGRDLGLQMSPGSQARGWAASLQGHGLLD